MDESKRYLKSAIESRRSDILKSVLEACGTDQIRGEKNPLLRHLLEDQYTDSGTLLHAATKGGDIDSVRMLLFFGSSVALRNSQGQTAYELASENVANVYRQHLLQAIMQSHLQEVCRMLDGTGISANSNDGTPAGNTLLHYAAMYSSEEVVKFLCERGAAVNSANSEGVNILHEAIKKGDLRVLETLLKFGADPHLTPSSGEFTGISPKKLAEQLQKTDVLSLIDNTWQKSKRTDNPPSVSEVLRQQQLVEHFANGSLPDGLPTAKAVPTKVVNDPRQVKKSTDSAATGPRDGHTTTDDVQSNSANPTEAKRHVTIPDQLKLLFPKPQRIRCLNSNSLQPTQEIAIELCAFSTNCCSADQLTRYANIWLAQRSTYEQLGYSLSIQPSTGNCDVQSGSYGATRVVCMVDNRLLPRQDHYRVTVFTDGIRLVSNSAEGLFYAVGMVTQMFCLTGFSDAGGVCIPCVQIDDWPSFQRRSMILDFSSHPQPTVDHLLSTIDLLGALRYNEVKMLVKFGDPLELALGNAWNFPYSPSDLLDILCVGRDDCIRCTPVLEVNADLGQEKLSQLEPSFRALHNAFNSTYGNKIGLQFIV